MLITFIVLRPNSGGPICIQVLVIDGKMQSAEIDEFIYHECLIHPALLCHPK